MPRAEEASGFGSEHPLTGPRDRGRHCPPSRPSEAAQCPGEGRGLERDSLVQMTGCVHVSDQEGSGRSDAARRRRLRTPRCPPQTPGVSLMSGKRPHTSLSVPTHRPEQGGHPPWEAGRHSRGHGDEGQGGEGPSRSARRRWGAAGSPGPRTSRFPPRDVAPAATLT